MDRSSVVEVVESLARLAVGVKWARESSEAYAGRYAARLSETRCPYPLLPVTKSLPGTCSGRLKAVQVDRSGAPPAR